MIKHLIILWLIALSFQIEHCEIHNTVCKSCAENFELVELNFDFLSDLVAYCFNSEKLSEANDIIPNCVSISEDKQSCEECRKYYFWDSNQKECINIPHCSLYDPSDHNCILCESEYALKDDGSCVKNLYCDRIKNETCIECILYYYPNDEGECVRIPKSHCMAWNTENCTYCENYYYPNSNGECEKIPLLNCLKLDNDDPTKCEECEENYYLDKEGKCQKHTIDNCFEYESENKCKSCDYSYQLNEDGNCQLIPGNCFYLDKEGNCEECNKYYYLDDGQCKKITIDNCAYLNGNNTKCIYCDSGYELSEDETQCTKACEGFDDICFYCSPNYYPFNNGTSCHIIPELSPDESNSKYTFIGLIFFIIIALFLLFYFNKNCLN